ncbi:MAG: conjugal transfer protein TrbF [Gammaproteobacteria bacterium]|nr:conjugal transfer protein TrbF [Gammaproteobacteria bacterium]
MLTHISRYLVATPFLWLATMPAARAQWAVVDAPAIVQLIQEVQTQQEQLQTARDQLVQAKQALQAMTGNRGMELLLSGTSRNYLPSNFSQLAGAMRGTGGGYSGLSSDVRSAVSANAVLTPQQLSMLSAPDQQIIVAGRQSSALREALAQQALANTSARFASIQSLVAAIGTAGDQKAILDLEARISAELGMLQNEQTKLQVLQQATQAQDAVNSQREREQVIAGHGRFESRFQPAP